MFQKVSQSGKVRVWGQIQPYNTKVRKGVNMRAMLTFVMLQLQS